LFEINRSLRARTAPTVPPAMAARPFDPVLERNRQVVADAIALALPSSARNPPPADNAVVHLEAIDFGLSALEVDALLDGPDEPAESANPFLDDGSDAHSTASAVVCLPDDAAYPPQPSSPAPSSSPRKPDSSPLRTRKVPKLKAADAMPTSNNDDATPAPRPIRRNNSSARLYDSLADIPTKTDSNRSIVLDCPFWKMARSVIASSRWRTLMPSRAALMDAGGSAGIDAIMERIWTLDTYVAALLLICS
jgi:hypothetical protein